MALPDERYVMPDSLAVAWNSSLDDVTVSATKHSGTLVTSQTLDGRELQQLSSTSVADALKYFAGVQIKDYGGLGGLKTVNVRSLGSQHVGVYLDGVRITNAQNGTVDLGKFSLSTMESVSLYNANRLEQCQSASEYASGATVYMQTRRPQADSLSVQARLASFHTYGGRINAQLCRNGWSGFIDGEYVNSGGDYPFRYQSRYEDTIGVRANSDIRYYRIEGAAFTDGFSSHIYYYNSERGCPDGEYLYVTSYAHECSTPDGTFVGSYTLYLNPAHFLALGEWTPTGVAPVADFHNSATYNLQGIRALPDSDGIVITNGRKHLGGNIDYGR